MSTRFSRAVITGGAGFLGSHLCEHFLRRGTGVVCLDSFRTGTPANIAHLIRPLHDQLQQVARDCAEVLAQHHPLIPDPEPPGVVSWSFSTGP